MKQRLCVLLTVFGAFLLVGMTSAFGANITITDKAGTITVNACDFEGGFQVNGTPFPHCGVGYGGILNFSEAGGITFSGSWIDEGLTTPGTHTIYFVEPTDLTHVSDILKYTYSTNGFMGTISGSFVSEDGSGPLGPLPPGAVTWNEGLGARDFSAPFLSASASSEVTVPEPASLLLLGGGLFLLGRKLRK